MGKFRACYSYLDRSTVMGKYRARYSYHDRSTGWVSIIEPTIAALIGVLDGNHRARYS